MFAATLQARGEPQRLILIKSLNGPDRHHFRLPKRQGSGLVDHKGIDRFAAVSRASAFFIKTPKVAPGPTPTMIDIGVARPNAQGQAMIKTETAATSPNVKRGSGPQMLQAMKAATATAITVGTNQPATLSASR